MRVDKNKYGRGLIHITSPHCSPLIHLLPETAVEEVELHDFAVDEPVIADGTRIHNDTMLCALSAEAKWLDGEMHLIQHIIVRGPNIRDAMEAYFIALQAKEVATYMAAARELERATGDAAGEGMGTARPSPQAKSAAPSARPWTPDDKIPN
ncbi:MAG: hypothetical protein HYV25_01675 [Candidatus Harrisonbacteria bacterium]|nr:hypothetical protein [Candidatus Harrisonbacteria bacterium]